MDGEEFKRIRLEMGLTQSKLCEIIGSSRTLIANIEKNKTKITNKIEAKINHLYANKDSIVIEKRRVTNSDEFVLMAFAYRHVFNKITREVKNFLSSIDK